jgi:uncharacterized protein YukJ
MENKIFDLINTVNQIDLHGMATLIAASDIGDRLTKKSRADKSPRPDFLDGLVRYTMSVVSLKHDYNKAVINQISKAGGNPADWNPEESTVSQPDPLCPNGIIRMGLKDTDKKYMRVFVGMSANKSYDEVYINAKGENVTHLITEEIKENFFPLKYGSEKQLLAGSQKEVIPREYKAENVLYIQKGNTVFNVLTQDIMDLFGLV